MTIETNNYKYEIYNLPNELYPTIVISKKTKSVFQKDSIKKVFTGKKAKDFIFEILKKRFNKI